MESTTRRRGFTDVTTQSTVGQKWKRQTSDQTETVSVKPWNGGWCVEYKKLDGHLTREEITEKWRQPGFSDKDDALTYARKFMHENGGVVIPE